MTRTKTFPAMLTAIATAAALLVVGAAPAAAAPIASAPPPPSLPDFQGHAVRAHPVTPTRAPQNPFMGANPFNNIHNDTWMTDAYQIPGPLGSNLVSSSDAKGAALCGSLTFDTRGQILSVCPSAAAPPQARIIDPDTLATIDSSICRRRRTHPAPRPTRTSPAAATSSSTTRTACGCRPRLTTSS